MNHEVVFHPFLLRVVLSWCFPPILKVKIEVLLQKKHTDPIDVPDSVNQDAFLSCLALIRWASRARLAVWMPNIQSISFCSVRALIRCRL